MPITAVPEAPIPVHTAYAGPTSRFRRAIVSKPKLTSAQAAKPVVGQCLVRPWLCLRKTANPVSKTPATTMRNQAIDTTPRNAGSAHLRLTVHGVAVRHWTALCAPPPRVPASRMVRLLPPRIDTCDCRGYITLVRNRLVQTAAAQ